MAAQSVNHKTGVVIGTGALLNVKGDKCGFKPSAVRILNVTDGSFHFWQDTMADDSTVEQKGGTTAVRTSGGIIPLSDGFSIGTQSNLNANLDVLHFECWG